MTISKRRVLIAEDDPLIRELVVDVLIDRGYEVLEASNGSQAIQLMDDPDGIRLVVTDLNMPGASGIEVAHHARRHHPDIVVLFMSGRPDLLVAGRPPEPFLYLPKPFRLAELLAAVDGLV